MYMHVSTGKPLFHHFYVQKITILQYKLFSFMMNAPFWFLHSHLFMDHNPETATHTRYTQQFHFMSWVQNLTLEQYHALHEVSWCLLLNRSLANTHTEKFKLYIFTHSTKSLNHMHVQLATLNYFTWHSRHLDEKYLQPAACMIAIYILTVYFRSWYFLALYVCIAEGDLPDMSCNEYEFVKNLSLSILWWNAIERFQYDRYTAKSAVIWGSPSCTLRWILSRPSI